MRAIKLLVLTDRLSLRGGADLHLRDVLEVAAGELEVRLASGRGAWPPLPGVASIRVKGLAGAVARSAGLGRLGGLLDWAEVVHVQNVMNPVALEAAAGTGRAVVTVQDHRVFCPGPGKVLPDGSACSEVMGAACGGCFEDAAYGAATLALTRARRDALRGARLVVLSGYMAAELAAAGLPGAAVIPPWIRPGAPRIAAGRGFVIGGRLVWHKAPLAAVEAWRQAGSPQELTAAGAGPIALPGDVRRVGWLDRQALRGLLRASRALILTGRWQEPFGILGAEALAEGTPVIAWRTGGVEDWAGRGCILLERGDVSGTAAAIRRLARDGALALRLGREGQAGVAGLERGRLWGELSAIYREIAG